MANKFAYPSSYELQEILGHIADRSFLDRFAQRRGVFITNVRQEELSKELSNLFFDNDDLEQIRKEAYRGDVSHNLSGFVVKKKERKEFSLVTVYEKLVEEGKYGKGIIPSTLTKITTTAGGEDYDYKGSIEYTKARPGRIEFLQDESHSFEFYFKELPGGDWKVEIDCGNSNDMVVLKDILSKGLTMGVHDMDILDQTKLTTEQTITFFDALAKRGLNPKEWDFEHVAHLTIKRERKPLGKRDPELTEDEDSDDDEKDFDSDADELVGITQAILKGKDIREDPFVKNCVEQGYRFHSMTYRYTGKKTPLTVHIQAEFKGRPKVFEVGIKMVKASTGTRRTKSATTLSDAEDRKLRSAFWNNSRNTYTDVVLGKIKSARSSNPPGTPNSSESDSPSRPPASE